jgi:hypothetical protein
VEPHIESGHLTLVQVDPAELSPGEFADRIRSAVDRDRVSMVVIDSLNGYLNSMPEERFLLAQLHELFMFLRQKGVLAISVVAQHGLIGSMQTPIDLSYLADNVILLRFFEAEGRVRQAISVLKKRSGMHERTIRELRLEPGRVSVGEPLTQFHGVLTGNDICRFFRPLHRSDELMATVLCSRRPGAPTLSCAMLGREGFAADACTSIEHLCGRCRTRPGAADRGGALAGCRSIAWPRSTLGPWSDIPLIVLAGGEFTASSTRPLNVLRPLRNVMILERPVRRLILMRTVSVALRARKRQIELQTYLEERADLLKREQLAREQAELANRMKDEFLMTVSHELRTPLTAIYGWARMLLTGELRESQRQRAIETIERNAHAQTQLVNDLLDVSRAIWQAPPDVRAVDLSQVVLAAVDRCSRPRTQRAFGSRRSSTRRPGPFQAIATGSSRLSGTSCPTPSSSPPAAGASRCVSNSWNRRWKSS